MKATIKRIPVLLLAAVMALTLFPMAALAATHTINTNGSYDMATLGVASGDTISINAGLAVTLTGYSATTYTDVKIDCGAGVSLTLNNVNIDNSAVLGACALSFTGADNTLTLVGESTLLSGENQPGVKVESSTELTIEGGDADQLTTTGGRYGAGIGGASGGIGGKITINSGVITAVSSSFSGGNGGAGIGGGNNGSGGIVIINGGTVTGIGSYFGAGIGGGAGGAGGVITINGGTVTATSGITGTIGTCAGIGGGRFGDGGNITILGGTVTASGGRDGAGIGGGYRGNGGVITISGGTVTANSRSYGAGIGGGYNGSGGVITISDGIVMATSDWSGAGIGGGHYFDGGTIIISGGTVTASSTSIGAGIGGGGSGSGGDIAISGGAVTASSLGYGAGIGGGGNSSTTGNVVGGSGGIITISAGTVTTTGGENGAGIGGGFSVTGGGGSGGDITISGGTVTATGGTDGAGIGGAKSTGTDGVVGGSGGTVIISGGSVRATGNGDGKDIGGGAGATDQGTLQNEDGDVVYLTTIQLLGSGAGNAAVSSLTNDLTYEYGLEDVYSDNLGWLYFYLPLGTETTEVVTSAGTFAGGAVTAISPTSFYFAAGGADGREIELQVNETHIQWRYVGEGDVDWRDLIAFSALAGEDGVDGADGREIELRVDGGYIQWHYIGESSWNNIVALSAITGPQGAAGEDGADGADGTDGREIELRNSGTIIQWRYVGETAWNDLVTLAALTGADGREIELRVDSGYIQWRYVGGSWTNLMAVSVVAGPQGPQGEQGVAGADGVDGRNGNGITSITKTATDGNVDTYTIFFTSGTSTTFTVTNGKDGVGVASAAFNESGELVFTLTDGTQINLGPLPGNSVPASGAVSGEKDGTVAAIPIALGAAALLSAQLWWLLPLLRRKIFKL